jgi:hypothetical protein
MTDFLNFKIGSPTRTVTVKSIDKTEINVPSRDTVSEKIVFTVSNGDSREFQISDAWIEDHKGARKIQGLWFTLSKQNEVAPASALAKVLNYYEVDSLNDLVGHDVTVHPDDNNFLVLAACDMNETPTEKTDLFN